MEKSNKYYHLVNAVAISYDISSISYNDEDETFSYLFSTIDPKEVEVVKMRFFDHMTLRKIGELMGVSGERIRQIEHKALRKLRHPSRLKYVLYGKSNVDEMDALRETKLQNSIEYHKISKNPDNIEIDDIGLSVRAYNCLKRAGIITLHDLSNLTKDELINIRNLGHNTADEVEQKMLEYNVHLRA